MFDFVSSRDLPRNTESVKSLIFHRSHKEHRGNAIINLKIHFVFYVPFVAEKTGDFLIMSFRF
jgi:hypothetical protein